MIFKWIVQLCYRFAIFNALKRAFSGSNFIAIVVPRYVIDTDMIKYTMIVVTSILLDRNNQEETKSVLQAPWLVLQHKIGVLPK